MSLGGTKIHLGMVVCPCGPSAWEEARSQVQERPGLYGEALSQKYRALRSSRISFTSSSFCSQAAFFITNAFLLKYPPPTGMVEKREGRILVTRVHGHLHSFAQLMALLAASKHLDLQLLLRLQLLSSFLICFTYKEQQKSHKNMRRLLAFDFQL